MVMNRTLKSAIEIEGIGVHTGKSVRLRIRPSEAGRIVYRRTDLRGIEMPLDADKAITKNSIVLKGEQFQVQTVEHLLATLWAAGVGSCVIEIDADEIPIMDGSALPFVEAIERAGTIELGLPRRVLRIAETATVEDRDAWVRFEPAEEREGEAESLVLSYTIAYDHPAIGVQSWSLRLTWPEFSREIAPARTFGFLKDVEGLRGQGLALGASDENTVVLDETKVVNPPLRFGDEFVRHKLLDLAGDLALLGRAISGRVTAHKAGHRLHLRAVRHLLSHLDLSEER
jgi:UDP-3-O-[3-hydroxymyristoyl] N-acetylglucosamine deacetylase